jgi:histidinol dehydrogenase
VKQEPQLNTRIGPIRHSIDKPSTSALKENSSQKGKNPMKIFRYPSAAAEKKMKTIIGRNIDFRKADVQAVTRILNDVKRNGDSALIRYSRQFDAPHMGIADIAVTPEEMAAAHKRWTGRSCGH